MAGEILLDEASPNGNLGALVEQDERCAYLYLQGPPESQFGVRSCWVRNLVAAPADFDRTAMERGEAPMMPARFCAHPSGAPPLDAAKVRLVWLEEGDAVALKEGDDVLAVIPGWSGTGRFNGYARDCNAESPLAWPLKSDSSLLSRLNRAEEWWASWDEKDPWPPRRAALLAALESALGPPGATFAIGDGAWPPRALAEFPRPGAVVLVTMGMSLRPQPRSAEEASAPRRIELALAMDRAWFDRAPDAIRRWVSVMTQRPWERFSWLGHGHTVPCKDVFPIAPTGERFNAAALREGPPGAPAVALPAFRGDAVHLLWATLLTDAELALAQEKGGAEVFLRLDQKGCGFAQGYREPVA